MSKISADIAQLQKTVQDAEAGQESAKALIVGIADRLDNAVAQGDLDEIETLTASLRASTDGLSAAVAAVPGNPSPQSGGPAPAGQNPNTATAPGDAAAPASPKVEGEQTGQPPANS